MPEALGGLAATPAQAVTVIEDLSRADASVGWCAMIGVGNNVLASMLPESGAREVFVDGSEVLAGAVMPNGRLLALPDGSFRLNGRWPFASGIDHCPWVCAGALLVDESGNVLTTAEGLPEMRFAFMPTDDVEVLDTWDVAGLEGTASHDFAAHDVVIPPTRVLSLFSCRSWWPGAVWRILESARGAGSPFTLIFPIMGAVPLGIARRAIEELVALATDKTPYRSSRRLCERDVAQAAVARAEALTTSARCYLLHAAEAVWDAAERGDHVSMDLRAQARLATTHAGQACAEAVRLCYQTAGGTAPYKRHPMQRLFRDAHVATQHWVLAPGGYETAGRVLFGLPPDIAL
jgi:alkylation response protein AidB-like acyl-CoA dehydrogenase